MLRREDPSLSSVGASGRVLKGCSDDEPFPLLPASETRTQPQDADTLELYNPKDGDNLKGARIWGTLGFVRVSAGRLTGVWFDGVVEMGQRFSSLRLSKPQTSPMALGLWVDSAQKPPCKLCALQHTEVSRQDSAPVQILFTAGHVAMMGGSPHVLGTRCSP